MANYLHVDEVKYAVGLSNSLQTHINNRIQQANQSPTDPGSSTIITELGDTEIGTCNVIKRKRDGLCSYPGVNIKRDYDIESSLMKILNMFYDKNIDPNILYKHDENEKIENINELYEIAESIEDILKYLLEDYIYNIDKFTENESKLFITGFNEMINGFINYISDSKYINYKILNNIDDENIQTMKGYFDEAYDIHIEKHGYITDDNEEGIIYNKEYNKDPQSKYHRNKLLRNIKKLLSLINEHNNNIINEDSLGVKIDGDKFTSEIDPKSILESDNLMEGIQKMRDEIQNLDIDSLDEDKQNEYNEKLYDITNELKEIKDANDHEYKIKGIPSLNSEAVHILYNACASKQGIETDDNILPSENYLSVPELENIDGENENNKLIINNLQSRDISIKGKNYIFKGLENHIIYSDGDNLDDTTYSIISSLEEFIRKESLNIEGLQSHEGNHKYVNDFILFSNYYNHLVAVATQYDKIYSESLHRTKPVTTIELRNSILLRLLFINNNELTDTIQEVVKNNPDKYNQDIEFDDIFASNLIWGNSVIKRVSLTDLNKIFKEPKYFTTLASCMNEIIKDANNNPISKLLMQKAYHSKYNYVKYLSPASRDPSDIEDLNLNMSSLDLKINKGNIETIEDYSSSSFYEAMSSASKFNKDINIEALENGNEIINVPDLYKGAISYSDMFKKMDKCVIDLYFDDEFTENVKQDIDFSTRKFSIFIRNTKFKFILTLGREHKNTFNNFVNEFSNISNGVFELLKSHNAVTDNNDKLNEKLFNLNNVRVVQNESIKLNSVTKKAKDLRLKKKTGNKNKNQNQNL